MSEVSSAGPWAVEVRGLVKRFGGVEALAGVDCRVRSGEILAVLGDNGAGKSTLMKILSGVFTQDAGSVSLLGKEVKFASPRDARAHGIATVFQDLAIVDLLSISRNFFLGAEPVKRFGPLKLLDMRTADRITRTALSDIGIDVRDTAEPAAILSGGERQSIAIARAVHFGASVLILDEPTSALGARESAKVLSYMIAARGRGLAVLVIAHNLHHVTPVADRFVILDRGRNAGTFERDKITDEELNEALARASAPEEKLWTDRRQDH